MGQTDHSSRWVYVHPGRTGKPFTGRRVRGIVGQSRNTYGGVRPYGRCAPETWTSEEIDFSSLCWKAGYSDELSVRFGGGWAETYLSNEITRRPSIIYQVGEATRHSKAHPLKVRFFLYTHVKRKTTYCIHTKKSIHISRRDSTSVSACLLFLLWTVPSRVYSAATITIIWNKYQRTTIPRKQC